MKKYIILIAFALAFMSDYAFAQIINQQSTKMVGGSASLSYITNDVYSQEMGQFKLAPIYGNFVSNNFFLGFGANLQVTVGDGSPEYLIAVSPIARYYFSENAFLGAEIGVGASIYSAETNPLYLWNASIGKDFPLSNSVFLELALGYGKTYFEPAESESYSVSSLRLSFGVVATLGSNGAPNKIEF